MIKNAVCLKELDRPDFTRSSEKFLDLAKLQEFEQIYEEMLKTAQELQATSRNYVVDYFQVYVAAEAVHSTHAQVVLKLGTGCGKSYVAALLCLYMHRNNLKFALVSSDKFLVEQLEMMLEEAVDSIDVMTIETALIRSDDFDGFVIDEADRCLLEKGCCIDESKSQVAGFWDLLDRKAFLLTASLSNDMHKLMREAY